MTANSTPVFIKSPDRLPLVTEHGRAFLGLEHSKSPELVERMKEIFNHLNGALGFPDTEAGKQNQECFNLILRSAYPELMLDLADLIYVQHERPAVFLNFDHININLRKDRSIDYADLPDLNQKMEALFQELTRTLKADPQFYDDPEIIRLLSESYSYYIFQTGNFPWDEALPEIPPNLKNPLMDIATGLTGFNMIHHWPAEHPTLFLTDNMPFIIEGLKHYKTLVKKNNIEILKVDFGAEDPQVPALDGIWANKFMHHLQRQERQKFLHWAMKALSPGGTLHILDTDLEHRILKKGKEPDFKGKLIPGYLETLVTIEGDFCETLISDTKQAGFKVTHFDFNKYHDETDAYSLFPGDDISIDFLGFEIVAEK
jgi:hypothetical protein